MKKTCLKSDGEKIKGRCRPTKLKYCIHPYVKKSGEFVRFIITRDLVRTGKDLNHITQHARVDIRIPRILTVIGNEVFPNKLHKLNICFVTRACIVT